MKKTAPKPKPKPPMSLDDMTRELAAGLKDAIDEIDLECLKRDPEEAFVDLACRLIFRLRAALTIVPAPNPEERIRVAQSEAATRTFNIFTHWMLKHPGASYDTRMSDSGKFQIVVKTPDACQRIRLFFGETVQDAYAQAAQTLSFDDV